MNFLKTFLLIAFFAIGCNNQEKDKSTTRSFWPKTAKTAPIDTNLVMTKMSAQDLERFEPLSRSDFINFGTIFKDYELGKSINSATGNVQGLLLQYNFTPAEINTKNLGTVDYDFKRVSSMYELIQKFHLEGSASIKYFNFRGSARYEQSKNLKLTQYHEIVAARIYVEDREESLKKAVLIPEAKSLAERDKAKFIAKYGDQVITSKVIGGDFIALIEIESGSSEEQTSNKVHVDAAMKAWGASASMSVDLKTALEELKKTSKYSVKFVQNGIVASPETNYSTLVSLQELIDKYPQLVHAQGKALEYKKSSIFAATSDLPDNIQNRDFVPILTQSFRLKSLENNFDITLNTLPDLEYVIQNPNQFTKGSVDSAKRFFNLNYQAMRVYEHNWQVCASVPELCDRCLIFRWQPQTLIPVESQQKAEPVKKKYNIVISPEFQQLIKIPALTTAIVSIEGKVQYNHIGPLDCRSPQRTSLDFSRIGFEDPGGGGVRFKVKLMPFLEFQYYEINDGKEMTYGNTFPYKGSSIDIAKNNRDLILKYRMNLEWVYIDDLSNEIRTSPVRAVDRREEHIGQHIRPCGDMPLTAVVVQ